MVERDDRSLGRLFSELAGETGTLVRQEMELAKAEMTAKARTVGRSTAVIAAGGALAHVGALALTAAIVLGLGAVVPLWLSALVIGVVFVGAGYALVRSGRAAIGAIDPVPQQTMVTLQDGKAWVKEELR